MCRYASHDYRDHFACFRCRKAFKSWQYNGREEVNGWAGRRRRHVPREVACPECSRPMADMGLDFKAPPIADREAWRVMEALHANGFTFHNCGCGGGYVPPRRARELPEWLSRQRRSGAGELLSKQFESRRLAGVNIKK